MSNPADATRFDPFGEMGHVKAITLGDAARLVREATEAQQATVSKLLQAKRAVTDLEADKTAADTKLREAIHCLHLSALVEYIYVPVEPNADYTRVGFTRIKLTDATPAQILVVKQMKEHEHSLLTATPIPKETLRTQLKEFFEGKK